MNNNKNTMFTYADKGNTTVAIYRDDYTREMESLLSDKETYIEIARNPLNKLNTKIKTFLYNWNDNNFFSKKYKKTQLTQIPRFRNARDYLKYIKTTSH